MLIHGAALMSAFGPDPKALLADLHGAAIVGVIALVFAETGLLIGFLLPGDSLLFTAGLFASQSRPGQPHLNLAVLLVGCVLAAILGDQVSFTVGERSGQRLLRRGDSRLFRRRYVERTEDFFDRHGAKTIVLARFVPVVRTFAPVLAGVGAMNRRTFTIYNVVGATLWVFGVTLLGYFLGGALETSVDTYLLPVIAAIVLLSLLPPIIEWRRSAARARRNRSSKDGE